MSAATYRPGVCNIGPAEIRDRYHVGYSGLFITIVFAVLILGVTDTPRELAFLLIIPASVAAVGFVQARAHFCVRYGLLGLFSLSPKKLGDTQAVRQDEFRDLDRRRALRLLTLAVLAGCLFAGLIYLIK